MVRYFFTGIGYCYQTLKLATLIFCILLIFRFIVKRKHLSIRKILLEFIFICYCLTVLKITGILGIQHLYANAIIDNTYQANLVPFLNASLKMLVLNLCLFIPYGFLLPLIFPKKKWNTKRILLLGLITTILIEFIQIFIGRNFEIDDILMNSAGTVTGYYIYVLRELTLKSQIL